MRLHPFFLLLLHNAGGRYEGMSRGLSVTEHKRSGGGGGVVVVCPNPVLLIRIIVMRSLLLSVEKNYRAIYLFVLTNFLQSPVE